MKKRKGERPKRVILCGYYGQDNAGDEALLVSLLQMLPPGVEPIVLSARPAVTQNRYGVACGPNRDWGQIWQLLRQGDGFMWGGGSLVQDVTSVGSALYYLGLMALAQSLGLTTVAWAQGIGPLERRWLQGLTRWVLRRCQGVSVRDEASAQLVRQWGLDPLVAPDPVWVLESRSSVPFAGDRPVVAVNLRSHPLLTPARLSVLTQALVHLQQSTPVHLRLIPFQASQDWAVMEAIAEGLTEPYEFLYREDPRECKGLFEGVALTIGMRLHSLIMAAAEGNRCFALSYDPKVTRLTVEVGLPGVELGDLPTDPQRLAQQWQNLLDQPPALSSDRRQEIQRQTRRHQHLLDQIFGDP